MAPDASYHINFILLCQFLRIYDRNRPPSRSWTADETVTDGVPADQAGVELRSAFIKHNEIIQSSAERLYTRESVNLLYQRRMCQQHLQGFRTPCSLCFSLRFRQDHSCFTSITPSEINVTKQKSNYSLKVSLLPGGLKSACVT